MRRRTAIKTLGALAGASAMSRLLTGCKSGESTGNGQSGITTIVSVMMENRSYDHYLGARALEGKGGDGLRLDMSNPLIDGTPVAVHAQTLDCLRNDPGHSWNAGHSQFNNGANDSFVKVHQSRYGLSNAGEPMGYYGRNELPVTYALADAGTVCDAWFCSLMSSTWPNRMYYLSAQSGGIKDNSTQEGGYDWPSIFHRCDDAGVDWRYYYNDLPFAPLWRGVDPSKVRRMMWEFFDDAAAGTLPPVVFVEPSFGTNDDHPPHHPSLGQQFIASIYEALASSPQWENCLLVVTYDEHGGFFDHVPPPKAADDRAAAGFDQLGFRVPTIVAGPYVKPGHVSSVVYDHTSVLAHMERSFDLEPLTARDAAANDLMDCLDLDRLAAGDPLPPVQLPIVDVDPASLPSYCFDTYFRVKQDIHAAADAGAIPQMFDNRRDPVEETSELRSILQQLQARRRG